MSTLQKSILATLAFFDIFDYPLTLMELWQWLYSFGDGETISLAAVNEILTLGDLNNQIETKDGFYFLAGRSMIVAKRLERYNIAEDKFVWAKRAAWILGKLPFIRLVAVCNTLAYGNSRPEADIDFFIVTAKNRLWTARLISVFLFQFLGWRPMPEKQQNKICLSFFVSEEDLNLKKATLGDNDAYFHFWLGTLLPIYDQGGYYHRLLEANSWVKNYLPNLQEHILNQRRVVRPSFSLIKKIMEIHTDWLEKFYKYIQLKFMNKKLKELANKDSRVIVNNQMLKFHPVDRREEYGELWRRKLAAIFNN